MQTRQHFLPTFNGYGQVYGHYLCLGLKLLSADPDTVISSLGLAVVVVDGSVETSGILEFT